MFSRVNIRNETCFCSVWTASTKELCLCRIPSLLPSIDRPGFREDQSKIFAAHLLPACFPCLRCCRWYLGAKTLLVVDRRSCLELYRVTVSVKASPSQPPVLPVFSLPAPAWTASTSQTGWSSAVCALAEWALNFASAGELFSPYGLHRKIESVEWVVGRIRSLHRKKLLTWDKGNRIESVPPVVWDFNSFSSYGVVRHRITLIVRMLDKSLQVIWLKRVQNVEHVSAVW